MSEFKIIIVGAPRSGTYWMVSVLNKEFGISFPSETHFIPLFNRYKFLWGNLEAPKNRRKLLKSIFEFLMLWTPRSSDSVEYQAAIREQSLLRVYDEGLSETVVQNSKCYESLIRSLFAEFGQLNDAEFVGDKSAHFMPGPSMATLDAISNVKIIHVVRDGRDVAASWQKQWFGPTYVGSSALLWKDHVRSYSEWGFNKPDHYLEVRYEDFASKFDHELNRISAFINVDKIPFNKQKQKGGLAKALASTDSHNKILTMSSKDNLFKWRQKNPKKNRLFETLTQSELEHFDYPIDTPASDKNLKLLSFYSFIRVIFSKHYLIVSIKNKLPIILRATSLFSLPILSLANRKYAHIWKQSINLRQKQQ